MQWMLESTMEKNDPIDAVRIWIGLALCDSSLSFSEQSAIDRLLRTTKNLTSSQRESALLLLHEPADGEAARVDAAAAARKLTRAALVIRQDVHRAASLLAQLDGDRLSIAEKAFLQQLERDLGLPAS
jgi:hypothetical protein